MRRDWLGMPPPASPAADSAVGAGGGIAPGALGAEAQGIRLAGALIEVVSGGCPGARLGGSPVFAWGAGIPMPGTWGSPGIAERGAGGQEG